MEKTIGNHYTNLYIVSSSQRLLYMGWGSDTGDDIPDDTTGDGEEDIPDDTGEDISGDTGEDILDYREKDIPGDTGENSGNDTEIDIRDDTGGVIPSLTESLINECPIKRRQIEKRFPFWGRYFKGDELLCPRFTDNRIVDERKNFL